MTHHWSVPERANSYNKNFKTETTSDSAALLGVVEAISVVQSGKLYLSIKTILNIQLDKGYISSNEVDNAEVVIYRM